MTGRRPAHRAVEDDISAFWSGVALGFLAALVLLLGLYWAVNP